MSDEPPRCSFCFNHGVPLYEGGFDPPVRICAFCSTKAVAETQPLPGATPPPERPSREARLASIPTPKSPGCTPRSIRYRSNHRQEAARPTHSLVDTWDRDDPDPIITDPDLRNQSSNILLIGQASGRPLRHR